VEGGKGEDEGDMKMIYWKGAWSGTSMMCAKCGHRWREDSEREMREQKEQTE